MPPAEKRRRVPAMAPDDRRAALVEATIPLLHECGLDVSTKRIAAAAGVAEGTIFGVFKDKNSLLVAAMARAMDMRPTLDALAAIELSRPLRERMIAAARLVQQSFARNAQLMHAARALSMMAENHEEAMRRMAKSRQDLEEALTAVIEPGAAELNRTPQATARLMLLLTGANTYGPFADPENFDAAQLVALLLDGLLVRQDGSFVIPTFGDDN